MSYKLKEDPSASASHGVPKESIYALYVALMTILFALVVYPHYRLKQIKFALALFVINFIAEYVALMTTPYLHSVAFLTVYYITMIWAPVVLIHAIVRPRNANYDDIPTDSHVSVSVQPGSIPETNNENDNSSTDSDPSAIVTQEDAGTSSNSDSNSNDNVQTVRILQFEAQGGMVRPGIYQRKSVRKGNDM